MSVTTIDPQYYAAGWIHCFTGRRFYPLAPRVEDIDIRDIAHALACQTRYTGHAPCGPYSVAQHSVLVSLHCDPGDALWGLLHDAPEAWMCDLARPAKECLRHQGITLFDDIDAGIMRAVCDKFSLPHKMPPSVKRADELLLTTEARDFFGHQPLYQEWQHRPANGFAILPFKIEPWGWLKARRDFIYRFEQLTGQKVRFYGETA